MEPDIAPAKIVYDYQQNMQRSTANLERKQRGENWQTFEHHSVGFVDLRGGEKFVVSV